MSFFFAEVAHFAIHSKQLFRTATRRVSSMGLMALVNSRTATLPRAPSLKTSGVILLARAEGPEIKRNVRERVSYCIKIRNQKTENDAVTEQYVYCLEVLSVSQC